MILTFSECIGMEFTLTFLTYDRFGFSNLDQGLLLSFMGVLTALIQGGWVRRKGKNREPNLILQGIFSCSAGLLVLGYLAVAPTGKMWLYVGAAFLSVTNGTVVTCLTALASFSGSVETEEEGAEKLDPSTAANATQNSSNRADKASSRGHALGVFRSIGQLGRSLGPLVACSCYWMLGSVQAYLLASTLMFLLATALMVIFSRAKAVQKLKVD